jgi:hypothetical protein
MAYTTHVPILAGLAILGGVTGVGLGRSTIAQINPVYFQPVSSHFYGDMVPNRSTSGPAELGGTDYLQADYAYSAAPACVGCDDYPIDARPRREKLPELYDEAWTESEPAQVVTAVAEAPADEPPAANREWITRYTTYTIQEPAVQTVAVAPTQDES